MTHQYKSRVYPEQVSSAAGQLPRTHILVVRSAHELLVRNKTGYCRISERVIPFEEMQIQGDPVERKNII